MDDQELAAIEARAAAASPPPWECFQWMAGYWMVEWRDSGGLERQFVARLYDSWAGRHATPVRANRVFIAHAREDIPALCAEVRRLRELLHG